MSEQNKTRLALAVILLLGLVARLGYVYWFLRESRPVHGDGYAEIAQSIVTGKGFSLAPLRLNWFRTPGYPLFIATAWSVAPTSARYVALMVAQVAVSVATCGLLFVIANGLFGRSAALAAASLFALSPSVVVFCTLILPETLQLFWIALAALLALQLYRSARLPLALGLGLVWGAAGLTRPEATLLLAPLLLPALVGRHRSVLARLLMCATAVMGKIALMTPWVVRNYLVYGTFVLHVPVGGVAFAGWVPTEFISPEVIASRRELRAAIPLVEGIPVWYATHRIPILPNERQILEINAKLTSLGMTYLKTDRISQLRNMARRLYALWGYPSAWWDHWGVEVPRLLEICWYAGYLAFLALFGIGVVVAWKSGALGVVPLSWLALLAGHTGLFLFIFATARYQVTAAIFAYIFSGLGAVAILDLPALRAPTAAALYLAARRAGWNGLAQFQAATRSGEPSSHPAETKICDFRTTKGQ